MMQMGYFGLLVWFGLKWFLASSKIHEKIFENRFVISHFFLYCLTVYSKFLHDH